MLLQLISTDTSDSNANTSSSSNTTNTGLSPLVSIHSSISHH